MIDRLSSYVRGILLCCLPCAALAADLHPEVQTALDWQLPANPCVAPKVSGAERDVETPDGQRQRYGVDSYQQARYERSQKRWQKCVVTYKQRLLDDFAMLKNSARHGLTQPQADLILSKMALIQKILESPTASE